MDDQNYDVEVDPEYELKSLLKHNGIAFVETADEVRFALSDGSYRWETVCRYTATSVLIYGLYPFEVGVGIQSHKDTKDTTDRPGAGKQIPRVDEKADVLDLLNKTNKELTRGAMMLHENGVVMRTNAELYDTYGAYETIARALEYNAGAIVKYWHVFSSPVGALNKYERPDLIIKNIKMSDRKEVGSADKTM